MICKECGKMVLPENGHIIDGEFYCDECTVVCDECGDYILKDNAIETHEGKLICESCKDDCYFTCEDCGEIYHCDDSYWVDDKEKTVCNNCIDNYYECENCHKYFSEYDVYHTYDDNWVCTSCYDYHYRTCEDCGRVMHDDDSYYNDRDGYCYCPNCEDRHKCNDSIYKYHEFDDFCKKQALGEIGSKEFFGFEIEVSGDEDYADKFLDIVPDVVLMYDGSVDEGFEIVSQPMTRKYIDEKFLPNLEKGMKFLNNAGFRGHNQGGIHIHVSQEIFSKQMLCVLRNVLYSCYDEDLEVWKAITQRHQSEITQWCRYSDARSNSSILEDSNSYPKISDDRYTALNYDSRTGTYEFRIFNSNTRIERIKKNIQTVYSLIDYAKLQEPYYAVASTGGYIDFVRNNKEKYPELHQFMFDMGIVQRFEEERVAA